MCENSRCRAHAEKLLHGLPMECRAAGLPSQGGAPAAQFSSSPSVRRSGQARLVKQNLSPSIGWGCPLACAAPSGPAASVSFTRGACQPGARGDYLRLLAEGPAPIGWFASFASGYLTVGCAVVTGALMGLGPRHFSFGAVFGTSEWGSGRPIPVLEIITGQVEKNRAAR